VDSNHLVFLELVNFLYVQRHVVLIIKLRFFCTHTRITRIYVQLIQNISEVVNLGGPFGGQLEVIDFKFVMERFPENPPDLRTGKLEVSRQARKDGGFQNEWPRSGN
jgi:hypothetical protein